jgi:hypothetical protein
LDSHSLAVIETCRAQTKNNEAELKNMKALLEHGEAELAADDKIRDARVLTAQSSVKRLEKRIGALTNKEAADVEYDTLKLKKSDTKWRAWAAQANKDLEAAEAA